MLFLTSLSEEQIVISCAGNTRGPTRAGSAVLPTHTRRRRCRMTSPSVRAPAPRYLCHALTHVSQIWEHRLIRLLKCVKFSYGCPQFGTKIDIRVSGGGGERGSKRLKESKRFLCTNGSLEQVVVLFTHRDHVCVCERERVRYQLTSFAK